MTDLDDTLVGDNEAFKALNSQLIQHRREYGLIIAYITGRSLESYQKELKAKRSLLESDILASSVGTEIYYNGSSIPNQAWSEHLSLGWDRDLIVATLADVPNLIPQPDEAQRTFKISYFLNQKDSTAILPQIEFLLQEQGLERNFQHTNVLK